MKTAIIGAAGEIGARLTQVMLLEGDNVRAISRKKSPRIARWGDLDFIQTEIPLSENELQKALQGCDVVVNCVVDKKAFESDDVSINSNKQGLRDLIEVSIKLGVKKFIHLSTIAVLPPRLTQGVIDNPFHYSQEKDWYTRVKIETEKVAFEYKDKINLCVLRPGIVYGPYLHWSRMGFFKTQTFKVVVPYVPNSVCHAIHVDDLVGLIRHLLPGDSKLPGVLFGINPEPVTWKTYYELHANALGLYDDVTTEESQESILKHYQNQKNLEKGLGFSKKTIGFVRNIFHGLPETLIQNAVLRKMLDVIKVTKRGLPFYTQLYLPPPKQAQFPTEFELELYSTTALFPPLAVGSEQGYMYRVPFSEGVKSAAAWWNFQV